MPFGHPQLLPSARSHFEKAMLLGDDYLSMVLFVVEQTFCNVSDKYLDYLTGKFLALKVSVSETICFPCLFNEESSILSCAKLLRIVLLGK